MIFLSPDLSLIKNPSTSESKMTLKIKIYNGKLSMKHIHL